MSTRRERAGHPAEGIPRSHRAGSADPSGPRCAADMAAHRSGRHLAARPALPCATWQLAASQEGSRRDRTTRRRSATATASGISIVVTWTSSGGLLCSVMIGEYVGRICDES
jgi:hypothetical protein